MKTTKEYLKEVDRNKVIGVMEYDLLSDYIYLKEHKAMTIEEICRLISRQMNHLIDNLLEASESPSKDYICYLHDSMESGSHELKMDVCRISEIKEDIDAPGYDICFSGWTDTLGMLVSDNKLTQDNITELIAQYLHSVSMFGVMPETWKKNREKMMEELEKGCQDFMEGNCYTLEEIGEKLHRDYGMPIPEDDETQNELSLAVMQTQGEYDLYCRTRERQRILDTLER